MHGNGEKILIVDDDEGTRKSLALILKSGDYQVDTVANGKDAIDRIKQQDIDIVLADIKLPDMEGIDLLSMIKHINPAIAILIITGFPSLETAMRAVNEGAVAYITKPLNMNEVLSTINNLAQRKQAEEQEYVLNTLQYDKQPSLLQEEQLYQHEPGTGYLINRISTRFIDLDPADFSSSTYLSLKEIAEFSQSDCIWLVALSEDKNRLEHVYWWCRQDNDFALDTSVGTVIGDVWWMKKLKRLEVVRIPDTSKLSAEEKLVDGELSLFQFKSLLMAPISHMGGLSGFIGLGTTNRNRLWFKNCNKLLGALGDLFQSVLRLKCGKKIKVLIGIDESIISHGLSKALINKNIELTGKADNAEELIRLAERNSPDVVITSFKLAGDNLDKLIVDLQQRQPAPAVLMVSDTFELKTRFSEAIKAGACGCLPLNVSSEQLIAAVISLSHGHAIGSLEAIKGVMSVSTETQATFIADSPLNTRETEILQLASTGMSNKSIGAQLGISERTVDSHLRSVFRKTSVASRTEAIYKAFKQHWIKL